MRYDFGKVYKETRESKGLTQEEVCGGVLSRTSLSKIESGKTTPKYENMEFLLRQINMTFEEFDYICHLYQPSQRAEIMQTYLNMSSILGTSELINLFQKCQDYLNTHHDLPIEEISDMLEVVIYIRQHGTGELSDHAEQVVKKLWRKIEKQDTWYESDLKILNTILFTFPIKHIHLITGKILQRLEVYKNYQHLYDLYMTCEWQSYSTFPPYTCTIKIETCANKSATLYWRMPRTRKATIGLLSAMSVLGFVRMILNLYKKASPFWS